MRFVLIGLVCLLASAAQASPLRLAMVTSLESSGLGPLLVAAYEADTGEEVQVVLVGSGQAFVLARRGDVDLVLSHDPEGERALLRDGITARRIPIMENRFVLLGPPDDPAKIAAAEDIYSAFCRIAETQSDFVSRGDLSGTHRREQSLWAAINVEPDWKGYRPVGSGMAASLRVASAFEAYAMADWASALKLSKGLGLRIFAFDDEVLRNIYSFSLLDEAHYPSLNHQSARKFVDWVRGRIGQTVITRARIAGQAVYRLSQLQSETAEDLRQTQSGDGLLPHKSAPCRGAQPDRSQEP